MNRPTLLYRISVPLLVGGVAAGLLMMAWPGQPSEVYAQRGNIQGGSGAFSGRAVSSSNAPSGQRPSQPSASTRPAGQPSLPARASTQPSQPSLANRPSTQPSQPSLPNRPSTLPSQPSLPDRPSTLPSQPSLPDRPSTLPSQPSLPDRPSTLPADRPDLGDRPTTLPADRPTLGDRPVTLPADRPTLGDRPTTLPADPLLPVIERPIGRPGVDVDPGYGVDYAPPIFRAGWGNVLAAYQYYHGPGYAYPYDWYYYRHILYPSYYMSYTYDPVSACYTEYYSYEGVYYCYMGSGGLLAIPLPDTYLFGIDPQYQYYYGPTYAYEDQWYFARHISVPDLYELNNYDPYGICGTYYYLYYDSYYCFRGG